MNVTKALIKEALESELVSSTMGDTIIWKTALTRTSSCWSACWSQTPSLCSDTHTAGSCPVSMGLIAPTPVPPPFTTQSALFESGKHSTLNIHKPEYKAMRLMPQNSHQNKVLLFYSHSLYLSVYIPIYTCI